jgi:hypothetical protein
MANANMDVKPQKPIKFFKYQVTYKLANGDFQQLIPSAAQEGIIDLATKTLTDALTPTSSVAEITITIGDKKDTRA